MKRNQQSTTEAIDRVSGLRDRDYRAASVTHPSTDLNGHPSHYEKAYASAFHRYVQHTDGKQLLAEALIDLKNQRGLNALVDFGAGDGNLTSLLTPRFSSTIAIEKNKAFQPLLESSIPSAYIIYDRMENVDLDRFQFDYALISYSLNGLHGEHLRDFIQRVSETIQPGGLITLCTDGPGGGWGSFADEISKLLGIGRSGGEQRDQRVLKEVGINVQLLGTVDTRIWGESVEDLATILSCFFLKQRSQYFASINEVRQILERHVEPQVCIRGCELRVEEQILELRL